MSLAASLTMRHARKDYLLAHPHRPTQTLPARASVSLRLSSLTLSIPPRSPTPHTDKNSAPPSPGSFLPFLASSATVKHHPALALPARSDSALDRRVLRPVRDDDRALAASCVRPRLDFYAPLFLHLDRTSILPRQQRGLYPTVRCICPLCPSTPSNSPLPGAPCQHVLSARLSPFSPTSSAAKRHPAQSLCRSGSGPGSARSAASPPSMPYIHRTVSPDAVVEMPSSRSLFNASSSTRLRLGINQSMSP